MFTYSLLKQTPFRLAYQRWTRLCKPFFPWHLINPVLTTLEDMRTRQSQVQEGAVSLSSPAPQGMEEVNEEARQQSHDEEASESQDVVYDYVGKISLKRRLVEDIVKRAKR